MDSDGKVRFRTVVRTRTYPDWTLPNTNLGFGFGGWPEPDCWFGFRVRGILKLSERVLNAFEPRTDEIDICIFHSILSLWNCVSDSQLTQCMMFCTPWWPAPVTGVSHATCRVCRVARKQSTTRSTINKSNQQLALFTFCCNTLDSPTLAARSCHFFPQAYLSSTV